MAKKPRSTVEYRLVENLKELERNPRTITKSDFEKLKTSIKNNPDYFEARPVIFLGSGSTLIASEQTGRKCYGCEIDPKYCDVIRKRYWSQLTGSEDGWQEGTPAVGAEK